MNMSDGLKGKVSRVDGLVERCGLSPQEACRRVGIKFELLKNAIRVLIFLHYYPPI